MSKRRYRILAGTALALVLAAPFVSMAKNAVTPMTALPDQLLLEIAHASVASSTAIAAADVTADEVQGNATTVILNTSAPSPAPAAAAVEQAPAPDPLASLDPADRPIAENIRDLLAAKADKLFAGA